MLRGRGSGTLVETAGQTFTLSRKQAWETEASVGPKYKEQEQVYKSKPAEIMQGISSHSLMGFSQEQGQICPAQDRAGKEAVLLTSIKSAAQQSYSLSQQVGCILHPQGLYLSSKGRLELSKTRPVPANSCFCPREVVGWLVAAVTGIGFAQPQEQPQETASSSKEAMAEHSSSTAQPASTDQAKVAPPAFFAQK